MLNYEWPGNVRELENCVQHMVAINSGPMLHSADLPSAVQNHIAQRRFDNEHRALEPDATEQLRAMAAAAGTSASASQAPDRRGQPATLDEDDALPILPLMEVEKRAIMRTLEYARGDRAVAANLLGIGRTTLYRKLKEYRLAV